MRRRKQIERSNTRVDPADCPKPRIDDCGAYSVSTYSVEPTALATRHKNHENASRLFLVLERFLDERKKFEAYEYELAGYRLWSSLSLRLSVRKEIQPSDIHVPHSSASINKSPAQKSSSLIPITTAIESELLFGPASADLPTPSLFVGVRLATHHGYVCSQKCLAARRGFGLTPVLFRSLAGCSFVFLFRSA